jgi:hypothetical protein
MVPDRLPNEIRDLIKKFPAGSLQFEIGIQTWNPEVAKLVSRRNDYQKVKENFLFLSTETGVHTHADLIVGLPGETLESFAEGFDTLETLKPDEIQVGILKRLKGAPISRHDKEWDMVYSMETPFQILRTKTMDFATLQKMNRFAKFWDLYANSGKFKNFMQVFREHVVTSEKKSFFWQFFAFSEFLTTRYSQYFGISFVSLLESALMYMTLEMKIDTEKAKEILLQDFLANGAKGVPAFLGGHMAVPANQKTNHASSGPNNSAIPKRQQQHLGKQQQPQ